MKLFELMEQSLASEREELYSTGIVVDALAGNVTRAQYVAFLKEAYFHVSQTVPLLMACGSRLDGRHEWLRAGVAHYIGDEYGHEQWILDDIRACGADADRIRAGQPSLATELMISYAWDTIQRGNPVGFFGMVYVLEGTSVTLATRAARQLQAALDLPENAFRYLLSHGDIDQAHVRFLADLLNRLDEPEDRDAVLHCARRFFYLYAQIFRGLPGRDEAESLPGLRQVA